ncbi:MAG: Mrp/NBP35 family ATP-binding protein [Pseudomonadota bacterium]
MSDPLDQVRDALRNIPDPGGQSNIIEAGMVSGMVSKNAQVFFSITVPPDEAERLEPLRRAAEAAAASVPGVTKAIAVLTADKKQTPAQAAPSRPGAKKSGIGGVGAIIAVASGKGGVGKSTTTVNVALGLQGLGLRVGVLDVDIYGPSIPRLLGVNAKPTPAGGKTFHPLEAYGMKVMSMGFLVGEETPMVWRGPMVTTAINQMLSDVHWGKLDVLVVDMPPGTGDAQLTMSQKVPLSGAIIVSTPQDLALIDARKGIAMFQKVNVPILGVVENMSYFECPDTGKRYEIFGHAGAEKEAKRLGVPFLGAVPLLMQIRELSDAGTPVVSVEDEADNASHYTKIAERVWERVSIEKGSGAKPKIIFE